MFLISMKLAYSPCLTVHLQSRLTKLFFHDTILRETLYFVYSSGIFQSHTHTSIHRHMGCLHGLKPIPKVKDCERMSATSLCYNVSRVFSLPMANSRSVTVSLGIMVFRLCKLPVRVRIMDCIFRCMLNSVHAKTSTLHGIRPL